jgi:hypothetical protein
VAPSVVGGPLYVEGNEYSGGGGGARAPASAGAGLRERFANAPMRRMRSPCGISIRTGHAGRRPHGAAGIEREYSNHA